jgi:hypothetical protein
VVQQNAAMVEEATLATTAMKDQAAALVQTMARFHLDDESAGPAEAADTRRQHTAPLVLIPQP